RPVIDRRLPYALERVVIDLATALEGGLSLCVGALALHHLELTDLRSGDEVDAHHLDGGVEPVSVFAFIGLMERPLDSREPVVGDKARLDQHLGRVLLILISELAVAQHLHLFRRDAFSGELTPRQLLGFAKDLLDAGIAPPPPNATRV